MGPFVFNSVPILVVVLLLPAVVLVLIGAFVLRRRAAWGGTARGHAPFVVAQVGSFISGTGFSVVLYSTEFGAPPAVRLLGVPSVVFGIGVALWASHRYYDGTNDRSSNS